MWLGIMVTRKVPELEARDEEMARDIGWCLVHKGYKHTRTGHLSSQAAPSSANGYIVENVQSQAVLLTMTFCRPLPHFTSWNESE